jgi:two-component system alkaline phosphatase synthesis response regulator PhoP
MTVRGEARALTPMETELMWMLCEHAGEVVTSEALLEDVWGYPPGIKTRTLDVHIGRLRKKLGEDGRNPRHIITVRSVGYRFDPPSRDEDEEDDVAA